MEIDLSQYVIYDAYGSDRITLEGIKTAENLIDICSHHWVAYLECEQKCPIENFCVFSRNSNKIKRHQETLCEVGLRAIQNFVHHTFPLLNNQTESETQNYLDALYHYYKFVFDSQLLIGAIINEHSFKALGELAPATIGLLKKLRPHLDAISSLLKNLPDFNTEDTVLFVEGEGEEKFLTTLKSTHWADLIDLNVVTYRGKSNSKIKRIELLLRDYKNRGFEIYIQGDADGTEKETFETLQNRGLIKKENSFIFKHNFESSLPPCLLYVTLKSMGYLKFRNRARFISRVKGHNGSVIKLLSKKYGISLEGKKVIFGETVAKILANSYFWYTDENFLSTELGQFIMFVRNMHC